MSWCPWLAVWLASCTVVVSPALAQDPPAKPKAKIEFRWLAGKPVKGLTDEKGIQTSCGPELSYPHAKPVLTQADVTGTVLKKHDFSKSGGLAEQYTVEFQLTDAARNKLVMEAGDKPLMMLAIFVDGKYWGTGGFWKAEAAKFTPVAGFITSKAEADRIVEACK